MTMISTIERAANDVFPAFVAGLQSEFGTNGIRDLAAWFVDAEDADFHWEARFSERHLGAFECLDEDESDLERIAVIGRLNLVWYVATCKVDGDGRVHGISGLQHFGSAWDAEGAFADAL